MLEDLLTMSVVMAAGIVFALRIVDVTLGTMRTISLVQGRTIVAMVLGFFEVLVWIVVISEVMAGVKESPVLAVAYAAGFAAGNGVGILVERWVALGVQVVRIITAGDVRKIADRLRGDGQPVTLFDGEGRDGPVTLLYVTCPRKRLPGFLKEAMDVDPDLFYVIEPVSGLNRRVFGVPRTTGWRAVSKRK